MSIGDSEINPRKQRIILTGKKDMTQEESNLMDLYLANLLTEELLKTGYFLTTN